MKTKIISILVLMLLIAFSFSVVIQPIGAEPLPVEKVKEIPVPWQTWEDASDYNGVWSHTTLHEDASDSVEIKREYAGAINAIPLDDLTYDGCDHLPWLDVPWDPSLIEPGETDSFVISDIPQEYSAVLVRYTVAWAETPDVIEAHFINEAILESRAITGSLSNFDVHNSYDGEINNFELELYGDISPTDVVDVYDPPGDPYKANGTWYGGWGAPPKINQKPYGIEIMWLDMEHPVQYCEWFHCGVTLKPTVTLNGAKAFLTITKSRDAADNFKITMTKNKVINRPILNWLQCHPNLFPILQKLIQLFGLYN